jgi:hypothetical protein
MASFKLYRRQVSGGVVAALGVVEHLDVVKDVGPGLVARRVNLAADPLAFEQLEEALGHGVVMAIAAPAHAAGQVVISQPSARLEARLHTPSTIRATLSA